ncbi:MAG: MFS transporter [Bacillota bacterium]|nr:MFS transporter [Bacillota bacterium]
MEETMRSKDASYKVFSYRWVVLFMLVPVIVASEIFWLTFAPISSTAQSYYHVSSLGIDIFSMSYMFMYILFTMPASWVIEKYGFRVSIIIGAVLTTVFGITRFAFSESYIIALGSQFLLAAGQPFLVNVSTKVPANWFPINERSTASGILVMAQYIGFIIPMVASPILIQAFDMKTMLGIYAGIALIASVLAIAFAKEKPAIPPGPEAPKESMGFKAMGRLLINKNFAFVLAISFISMGIFNTLMTKIESILSPTRGFSSSDAGFVAAVFLISGIIGAVILPLLSDKICRRVPLLIIGIALMGPLCVGLTFFGEYALIMATAGVLGFLVMGLAPILFQHGAEVAYPVQEGASFGTIMMMGQISGIAFVYIFEMIFGATNAILWPMLFIIILAVLQIPLSAWMRESDIIKNIRKAKL